MFHPGCAQLYRLPLIGYRSLKPDWISSGWAESDDKKTTSLMKYVVAISWLFSFFFFLPPFLPPFHP